MLSTRTSTELRWVNYFIQIARSISLTILISGSNWLDNTFMIIMKNLPFEKCHLCVTNDLVDCRKIFQDSVIPSCKRDFK